MSTRKIREALERLQRSFMDDATVTALVAEAVQELKAIEDAAWELQSGPAGVINDRAIDAWLDMGEAIAKESNE